VLSPTITCLVWLSELATRHHVAGSTLPSFASSGGYLAGPLTKTVPEVKPLHQGTWSSTVHPSLPNTVNPRDGWPTARPRAVRSGRPPSDRYREADATYHPDCKIRTLTEWQTQFDLARASCLVDDFANMPSSTAMPYLPICFRGDEQRRPHCIHEWCR
jgi:hypothetical protein